MSRARRRVMGSAASLAAQALIASGDPANASPMPRSEQGGHAIADDFFIRTSLARCLACFWRAVANQIGKSPCCRCPFKSDATSVCVQAIRQLATKEVAVPTEACGQSRSGTARIC
jgi:hypothetical protein